MTTGNAPHLAMMASTNCAGTGIFSSLIIHKSQQTSPSLPRLLLRSDAVRITVFHLSTSMFGPPRNRNPRRIGTRQVRKRPELQLAPRNLWNAGST